MYVHFRNDFDESPENDELQTKKRIQFKQSHLRNVQIVDGVYQELNNDRDDSLLVTNVQTFS